MKKRDFSFARNEVVRYGQRLAKEILTARIRYSVDVNKSISHFVRQEFDFNSWKT